MCVIIRTPVIKRRKYKYFRNMSITIIIYEENNTLNFHFYAQTSAGTLDFCKKSENKHKIQPLK